MRKRWMGAAFFGGWLAAAAAANAQPLPATAAPMAPPAAAPAPVLPPPQGAGPLPAAPNGCPTPPNGLTPPVPPAPGDGPGGPDVGPSAFSGQPDACPPNAFNEAECCEGPCFHFGVDYLGWRSRGQNLPPLVTTGSLNDPIPAALGQPNTAVVFGGTGQSPGVWNGVRLNFEYGDGADTGWTLDGHAFVVFHKTNSYLFANDGSPGGSVLARPFFNVVSNVEDADPVAVPGVASGTLRIETPSTLYGGDVNGRYYYTAGAHSRISVLGGFRFLSLDEALRTTETSQDLPGLGVQGNNYFLSEDFNTHNRFYGGQAGLGYEFRFGPASIRLLGTLGGGPVVETTHNSAFTSITEPNGIVTSSNNSALYISPNNAGDFSKTRFAFTTEDEAQLGFDIGQHVRLTVGYSYLYVSSVARPGDQINRNVNVQPVGGPVFPPLAAPPTPQSTNYWVHGVDAGVRFSF